MKLVIDRSKWIRGTRLDSFLLRKSDGKMCCLGFYSLACGVESDRIEGIAAPSGVFHYRRIEDRDNDLFRKLVCESPGTSFLRDNNTCTNLMMTNDDAKMSDAEREASLTQQFVALGVEVEFVDETQS